MFDLVAEVSGQQMEDAATLQVARTVDLAQVPLAAGFVFDFLACVGLRICGEVPAEDDGIGPQVAVVSIEVGFAPLKPAEFLILKIQLWAGQVPA